MGSAAACLLRGFAVWKAPDGFWGLAAEDLIREMEVIDTQIGGYTLDPWRMPKPADCLCA